MTAYARLRTIPLLVLSFVILLMGSLQSVRAAEAELNPLLDTLHRFRLQNFMALNAYYNYSLDKDQATMKEVINAMNSAHSLQQSLVDAVDGEVTEDQLEALQTQFKEFAQLMNTNIQDVRKRGYPDLRLVSEMANKAQTLSSKSQEIYQILKDQEGIPTNPVVETARAAALTMAEMVTQYSARSTSSVAQVFQGADVGQPLDEMARNFDDQLRSLAKNAESEEARQKINEIASKWNFIRNSYINFNEKNVSYVINRYSKGIIQEMEAVTPMLGSTS